MGSYSNGAGTLKGIVENGSWNGGARREGWVVWAEGWGGRECMSARLTVTNICPSRGQTVARLKRRGRYNATIATSTITCTHTYMHRHLHAQTLTRARAHTHNYTRAYTNTQEQGQTGTCSLALRNIPGNLGEEHSRKLPYPLRRTRLMVPRVQLSPALVTIIYV